MSGKSLVMAQEFARTVMRAWREQKPMKCLVVMACGCRALFEVDAVPRKHEDLVEGYLYLVREHECPTRNLRVVSAHDEMLAEVEANPPWQDV